MTPPHFRRRLLWCQRYRRRHDIVGIVLVTGTEAVDEVGEDFRADVDDVHLEHVLVVEGVDVFQRRIVVTVDDVLAATQPRRDAQVAQLQPGVQVDVLGTTRVALTEQRRDRGEVLLVPPTAARLPSLLRLAFLLPLPLLHAAVLPAPRAARVEHAVCGAERRRPRRPVRVAGMVAAVASVELQLAVLARASAVRVIRVARVGAAVGGAGADAALTRRDVLALVPL